MQIGILYTARRLVMEIAKLIIWDFRCSKKRFSEIVVLNWFKPMKLKNFYF